MMKLDLRKSLGIASALALAVVLSVMMLNNASPVTADADNGGSDVSASAVIAIGVDGGWVQNIAGGGPTPAPTNNSYTYASPNWTLVKVTDHLCKGDEFLVKDGATVLGSTSAVPNENPACTGGLDFDTAFADPLTSSGTFGPLGPGAHHIFTDITARWSGAGSFGIRVDTVRCLGAPATIVGTMGPDNIVGTAGADVIHGLGGDDILDGEGGDDTICGGAGDDMLKGDDGSDMLRGGSGDDRLYGQNGDDTLRGEDGNDVIYGGAGNDNMGGNGGNDRLKGEDGDDVGSGGPGNDTLTGGDGEDDLSGDDGNDRVYGNDDDDELRGNAGDDVIYGGTGDDELIGGPGNDRLKGESGDDDCNGGAGIDTGSSCETTVGIP